MHFKIFPSRRNLIFLLPIFVIFAFASLITALAKEDEKPKTASIKIFNASLRHGVEKWETGLNLKFHDEPLANDVRVGEGGLVRQITYKQKDTVDVFRNQEHLKNPSTSPTQPATKLPTTFDAESVTLLVVHGELGPNGENLKIEAIREFPVPEESRRPGFARLLLANFRQGDPVFLSVGTLDAIQLQHDEKREVFVPPGETDIFLIHRETGSPEYKRQLAAFKFKADHNYTGIISPAAEIPARPSLRISDSNKEWAGIRSPKNKTPE